MLVHFLLVFLLHVVQADEVELLTEYYFKKDLVYKEGNFKYWISYGHCPLLYGKSAMNKHILQEKTNAYNSCTPFGYVKFQ